MNILPKAPDWTPHLQEAEQLMWTGQPEFEELVLPIGMMAMIGLLAGPIGLLFLIIPIALVSRYARDAYALTNRRILAFRHPFGGSARIDALPRAGTYAGPRVGKGPRAVVFTAPDRTRITFQFQSRATQRMLIDSYPNGGPFPAEGIPI